jgi:hypothetical protein
MDALRIGSTGHELRVRASVTARMARYAPPMRGWLLVLLFAAGCSPQYTREQADNCAAAESAGATFWSSVATDSPAHIRETALAAMPLLVERLKTYPPGSTGADEEIAGGIQGARLLQGAMARLDEAATEEQVDEALEGMAGWYRALTQRCEEVSQHIATPSNSAPAPAPGR